MTTVELALRPDEHKALRFLADLEQVSLPQTVMNLLRQMVDFQVCAEHAASFYGDAPGLFDPRQPCPQCNAPTREDADWPHARLCDRCGEAVLFARREPGRTATQ
jgi:ribosomal protein S27AE